MTDKKPLLKQIKDTISPPPTPAQVREKDMIKRWKLKKDPKIPHRYWIDDVNYIRFVAADEESVLQAEAVLQGYFRGQQIESATPDQVARSPYAKTKSGGNSPLDKVAEAMGDLAPIGKNANEITDSMFSGVTVGQPSNRTTTSKQRSAKKRRKTNPYADTNFVDINIPTDEDFL